MRLLNDYSVYMLIKGVIELPYSIITNEKQWPKLWKHNPSIDKQENLQLILFLFSPSRLTDIFHCVLTHCLVQAQWKWIICLAGHVSVSLRLIICLAAATLFAPQASTKTFLAVLRKLNGDAIHQHLHKKRLDGSPVILTSPLVVLSL